MASTIFPAGGKNVSWMDNAAEKGTEEKIGTAAIDLNELKRLAALSDFLEKKEEEDVKVEDAKPAEDTAAVPAEENVPVAEEKKEDKTEEKAEENTEEKEEDDVAKINAAADAVEAAKKALESGDVEAAKTALDDASAAIADAKASEVEEVAEEVEIPVSLDEATGEMNISLPESKDGEKAVEVEIEGEVPVDSVTDKIEEKPVEKCAETDKSASRFYKIAMLSPDNKKKLANYWINILGYDADYVKLMVRDYEK